MLAIVVGRKSILSFRGGITVGQSLKGRSAPVFSHVIRRHSSIQFLPIVMTMVARLSVGMCTVAPNFPNSKVCICSQTFAVVPSWGSQLTLQEPMCKPYLWKEVMTTAPSNSLCSCARCPLIRKGKSISLRMEGTFSDWCRRILRKYVRTYGGAGTSPHATLLRVLPQSARLSSPPHAHIVEMFNLA